MKTACPNCGAEIEFRFDDSFVRVCASCRSAVTRTDRGVETLGKVADLAPLDSPLRLFAEGTYQGQSFLLVGKAQVRHAAGGLWQEWYAKLGGGAWGWLAEAQGRFYMTFEVPGAQLPAHYQLAPGAQVTLPTPGGPRPFTVAELGVATYTAADGELPFRLTPGAAFRFADLSDGQGGFATIDYGPPGEGQAEAATLYLGGQIAVSDLRLFGGEAAAPTSERITSKRLGCPSCGGSLELRAPDETLRIVCPYCNAMLGAEHGELEVLRKLSQKPKLAIPLGRKVTFSEGETTVIGYLRRSAHIDGVWYPFDEYLLHAPALGFRWLVCSDGHWSYVQPVAPGACQEAGAGATYQGTTFERFQEAPLRVEQVLGEMYWKVSVGETTRGVDFTAPPAMLSCERASGEINWSLSTYLTHEHLRRGAGEVELERAVGVAPNQPWRHSGVRRWYLLLLAALTVSGIVLAATTDSREIVDFQIEVPRGPAPQPAEAPAGAEVGHVTFSQPFTLAAGENVEISLGALLDNNWMYVVADLVDESKGTFVTFDVNLEYYHGYDGGESWSEGSASKKQVLAPLPAGDYVLRLEAQTSPDPSSAASSALGAAYGSSPAIPLTVAVRQNVFQAGLWGLALIVLLIPGAFFFFSYRNHQRKRMENSTVQGSSDDDDDDDSGDD